MKSPNLPLLGKPLTHNLYSLHLMRIVAVAPQQTDKVLAHGAACLVAKEDGVLSEIANQIECHILPSVTPSGVLVEGSRITSFIVP